jgi:Na+/proline symporter
MSDSFHAAALLGFIFLIIVGSFLLSGRRGSVAGFFDGLDEAGRPPGLWTLVLSQVTTWIFARSLLNAAVLGFYFGAPGALAYTAYYVSFLTGWLFVDGIRFRAGARSIHEYLRERFGRTGTHCFNLVIGLRLLSEVFANLLVVGIIFDALLPGSNAGIYAVLGLALLGLAYSAMGGLRASLRTDVLQMLVFLVVFGFAFVSLVSLDDFSFAATLTAPGVSGPVPGWVLLAVAALQVFSYPAHDPVMTDRGFIADRATTRQSFIHAFWISTLCIFGFGLLGVHAGLVAASGESMQAVWARLFNPVVLFCLNAALIVSAISTLDSTLSSASRLAIRDMRLGAETLTNGRIAMALFMLGGVLIMLADVNDLYAATAVSGTASMFLAPVLFFNILGKAQNVPVGSYLTAFAASVLGAVLYFFIEAKAAWALALFPGAHKYTALFWICVVVLVVGNAAFAIGLALRSRAPVSGRA